MDLRERAKRQVELARLSPVERMRIRMEECGALTGLEVLRGITGDSDAKIEVRTDGARLIWDVQLEETRWEQVGRPVSKIIEPEHIIQRSGKIQRSGSTTVFINGKRGDNAYEAVTTQVGYRTTYNEEEWEHGRRKVLAVAPDLYEGKEEAAEEILARQFGAIQAAPEGNQRWKRNTGNRRSRSEDEVLTLSRMQHLQTKTLEDYSDWEAHQNIPY